jgi:hypothetical protein
MDTILQTSDPRDGALEFGRVELRGEGWRLLCGCPVLGIKWHDSDSLAADKGTRSEACCATRLQLCERTQDTARMPNVQGEREPVISGASMLRSTMFLFEFTFTEGRVQLTTHWASVNLGTKTAKRDPCARRDGNGASPGTRARVR